MKIECLVVRATRLRVTGPHLDNEVNTGYEAGHGQHHKTHNPRREERARAVEAARGSNKIDAFRKASGRAGGNQCRQDGA